MHQPHFDSIKNKKNPARFVVRQEEKYPVKQALGLLVGYQAYIQSKIVVDCFVAQVLKKIR
jgi:hypothetical protein